MTNGTLTPASRAAQWETLADAARRTGLSLRTLRRDVKTGRLPAYRYGNRAIRVRPTDVDALLVPVSAAA